MYKYLTHLINYGGGDCVVLGYGYRSRMIVLGKGTLDIGTTVKQGYRPGPGVNYL